MAELAFRQNYLSPRHALPKCCVGRSEYSLTIAVFGFVLLDVDGQFRINRYRSYFP